MIDTFNLLFSQEFLIRALVVGVLICLCCALLGVSLVLKRFSMIGDGLSHVSFGAMAVGIAAGFAPLYFALPIVVVAAFLLLRMSDKGRIKGDAAIALVSTGALAVGVIATSMTTGMNVDIYNYMFGSILTMTTDDVVISAVLSCCVIGLFVIFYREIFAVTFDESFAKATGTKASKYNMLIAALTAVTIVIGMKMMGALLISSLIIFPTVSSMRLCKSFRSVILSSSVISVVCFFIGLIFSIKYEAPTGASVVCVNIFLLGTLTLIKKIRLSNLKSSAVNGLSVVIVAFSVLVLLFLLAYGDSDIYKKDRASVVATTFAPYDFARQIAGDCADVTMLLSPGEESHTYEPSPGDIMKIQQCDVFIYGGGESEKWVDDILNGLDTDIQIVRMMDIVELQQADGEHDHNHEDEHHHEKEYDEHVWTSPLNAAKIVRAISTALQDTDTENASDYAERTKAYTEELFALDNSLCEAVNRASKKIIVIGDRFPLMYFTDRYGLDYISAFSGCSAQTEANPVTIAKLIDTVNNEKIDTVFKVDLSQGNVAYTVSEATSADVMTLYSCHVISVQDYQSGETYISLMQRNLEALTVALD